MVQLRVCPDHQQAPQACLHDEDEAEFQAGATTLYTDGLLVLLPYPDQVPVPLCLSLSYTYTHVALTCARFLALSHDLSAVLREGIRAI